MRFAALFLVTVFLSAILPAKAADEPTRTNSPAATVLAGNTKEYDLVGIGTFSIDIPEGWTASLSRGINLGVVTDTVVFAPAEGNSFGAVISLLHQSDEEVRKVNVRAQLESIASIELTNSVETTLDIHDFKGPEISGCYLSLTDKTISDGPPADGQFKYLTKAFAKMDRLVVIMRVLSNANPVDARDAAIRMLKTARVKRSK